MPITLTALPPRAGIYVYELTAGPNPPAVALFRRTYVIGGASQGTEGVPVSIGSTDDFTNVAGTTSAILQNSVAAYLANTRMGLFFIRVKAYPMTTLTVSADAGLKTLTINSTTISYNAAAGASRQTILTGLLNAINDSEVNTVVEAEYEINGSGNPIYGNGRLYLRSLIDAPFTLSAGSDDISFPNVAAPAQPQYWDYLRVIEDLKETQTDETLGFLVCPDAFFSLTRQWERTQVGNALETAARELNWYAPIDAGPPSLIQNPMQAVAEAQTYTAVRGHSAYFYPYLKDSDNDRISPAMMMAAIALRRYEVEGIHKPPAGPRYPLNGIGGLLYNLSKSDLDLLATNKVNPFIYKRGLGYVLWDSYTRSSDTNFRHISTRIILSCLERTIQDTLDASGLLFDAVGSRGIFFLKVKNTIEQVLARFWEGDALYGVRPEDAYTVICDASVQTPADLEQGIVYAEVYAVPAGTARQIRVNVFRVQIGRMAQAIATSV